MNYNKYLWFSTGFVSGLGGRVGVHRQVKLIGFAQQCCCPGFNAGLQASRKLFLNLKKNIHYQYLSYNFD